MAHLSPSVDRDRHLCPSESGEPWNRDVCESTSEDGLSLQNFNVCIRTKKYNANCQLPLCAWQQQSHAFLGPKQAIGEWRRHPENIQRESKSTPPKTFDDIFALVESFCIKFCTFISNLYPHMSTDFRLFIFTFNEMALILLRASIIFTVSSFNILFSNQFTL